MTAAGNRTDIGPTSVLFVCLGNICRSPLAEALFEGLLAERGLEGSFEVDSAGTGSWHVGEPADPRMSSVARERGIRLTSRARQVTARDLEAFDWVIAMDESNLRALRSLAEAESAARLHRLRDFDPDPGDGNVPDPYYGGPDGFLRVFEIVERSCRRLLDHILDGEPP